MSRPASAAASVVFDGPFMELHSFALLHVDEGVHLTLGHSVNDGSEKRGQVVLGQRHVGLRELLELL